MMQPPALLPPPEIEVVEAMATTPSPPPLASPPPPPNPNGESGAKATSPSKTTKAIMLTKKRWSQSKNKTVALRCAHRLLSNKKTEQARDLVEFAKTATNEELSARLLECWSDARCSISECRLLLALGASPHGLYSSARGTDVEENADNLEEGDGTLPFGERVLERRKRDGSVCELCAEKYAEFLALAQQIHDAQFLKLTTAKTAPALLTPNGSTKSTASFASSASFASNSSGFGSTSSKTNQKSANNGSTADIGQGQVCLSLDGGGMRGLVSVVCLLFASRRCFAGDEAALLKMVDWYVGCSTGSMLSLALAKGYSLRDCFALYWGMKDEIFLDKSTTMKRLFGDVMDKQTANVCAVLSRVFTDEDTFGRCPKRLTVPALNVATSPAKLHTFRNYPITGAHCDDGTTFREAARASSAAPTYFHPHVTAEGAKYVDGSLVANCPLTLLFREYDKCVQAGETLALDCVLSVGTGEPTIRAREYDAGRPGISNRSKHLREVTALLMEQAVGYEQTACSFAADRCRAQQIPFFRLSPLGVNCRIDQVNDAKLADLVWLTLKWLTLEATELVDHLGHTLCSIGEARVERKRAQFQRRRCQTLN